MKGTVFLLLLEHKLNKVCDSWLRSVVQALLTGPDKEKFSWLEKDYPTPPPLQGMIQLQGTVDISSYKCHQDLT